MLGARRAWPGARRVGRVLQVPWGVVGQRRVRWSGGRLGQGHEAASLARGRPVPALSVEADNRTTPRWRGADLSKYMAGERWPEPPPLARGRRPAATRGPSLPRTTPAGAGPARDEVFRALVDATIAEAAARDDVDLSLVSVDSSFIGRRRRNARALVAARWARRSSTTDPDAAPGPCAGEHTWANAEENRRSVIRLPTCVDDSSAPAVSWPSELRITRNAGRPHPFRFRAGF